MKNFSFWSQVVALVGNILGLLPQLKAVVVAVIDFVAPHIRKIVQFIRPFKASVKDEKARRSKGKTKKSKETEPRSREPPKRKKKKKKGKRMKKQKKKKS